MAESTWRTCAVQIGKIIPQLETAADSESFFVHIAGLQQSDFGDEDRMASTAEVTSRFALHVFPSLTGTDLQKAMDIVAKVLLLFFEHMRVASSLSPPLLASLQSVFAGWSKVAQQTHTDYESALQMTSDAVGMGLKFKDFFSAGEFERIAVQKEARDMAKAAMSLLADLTSATSKLSDNHYISCAATVAANLRQAYVEPIKDFATKHAWEELSMLVAQAVPQGRRRQPRRGWFHVALQASGRLRPRRDDRMGHRHDLAAQERRAQEDGRRH